jgi:hypothetical protein
MPASQAAVRASPDKTAPVVSTVANPRVPATKIMAGFMAIMSIKVSPRQRAQFVINLLVVAFQAGISLGQQEDMVSETSFHFLAMASFSIAGNHESAWLSPNKIMVVFDLRLPYSHEDNDLLKSCCV